MFRSFRRCPYKVKVPSSISKLKLLNQNFDIVRVLLSPKCNIPMLVFLYPENVEREEVTEVVILTIKRARFKVCFIRRRRGYTHTPVSLSSLGKKPR